MRDHSKGFLSSPSRSIATIETLSPDGYGEIRHAPSLRHLVGTNRLWGANLGLAFSLDTSYDGDVSVLQEVAILSRTLVVLDDFLKDEHYKSDTEDVMLKFRDRVYNTLCSTVSTLGLKSSRIDVQRDRMDNAYGRCDDISIFTRSIQKCAVGFNPYKIAEMSGDVSELKGSIKLLEDFFFSCQLLDDIYDIEEDIGKKTNHNVFMEHLDNDYYGLLVNHRRELVIWTLAMINHNLFKNKNIREVSDNEVFKHYLRSAKFYIEKRVVDIDDNLPLTKFREFCFECKNLKSIIQNVKHKNRSLKIEKIRPEIFQTEYIGITDIREV